MNNSLKEYKIMYQKSMILFMLLLCLFTGCKAKNNIKNMESDTSLHYNVRSSKHMAGQAPLLLLLHGHGSNENDMMSLSAKIPDHWMVVSVRGPHKLAENSYRWYDVKMENSKILINIKQEEESRNQLIKLILAISHKYNVDRQKIIVAGFSQGANMAQSIGLGEPGIAAGFGVFSGRFVEEFLPYISKSTNLKNTKAFISHGSGDNMLPKTYAYENITKLKDLGIHTSYCEDTNGHTISTKQWNEFINWLQNFN